MTPSLQACAFLLGRLKREVRRLRRLSFPGHDPGPRKWLDFVDGLLDTASEYLASAQQPGTKSDRVAELIEDAEDLGDTAYRLITFIDGADSSQIPHQVVPPFHRWVHALGIKETLFFRAEHRSNYELRRINLSRFELLNNPSQSLVKHSKEIGWPVLRVSVPGHAMGLLPHFAVVGHELGHAIQERIKPDLSPFQKQLDGAISLAAARLQGEGRHFTAEHGIRARQVMNSWLNELKADAVGHFLAGPAFFFALFGFLELAGHGFGTSNSHPPSDLRRSLLFQELTKGERSFVKVLEEKTELVVSEAFNSPHVATRLPVDAMYQELKDSLGEVDAAICVELAAPMEAMAPTVFKAAESHLRSCSQSLVYTPEQLSDDLDRHLELACKLVPPIEYYDGARWNALSFSGILNVGWAALLTKVGHFPAIRGFDPADETAARMESLHELLLKAAELSEARSLWEAQV